MASRQSSRVVRRALIATGVVGAGAGLYITYRPRQIPGFERAAVPPPTTNEDGIFQAPNFPHIRSRDEQIADLKRSSSLNDASSGSESIREKLKNKAAGLLARRKSSGGTDGASVNIREAGAVEEDDSYDLLVIGGGATGAGIALDAATRGLKVAMVERDDYSAGTSSKSTKLVHGGVRYLEKAFKELDYNQ